MVALQKSFFERTERQTSFVTELEGFEFAGNRTTRIERDGVPFFYNEFWTARQRQAHSLHEISYRACFKPQLPAFFINRLTHEGQTVYDPFMGRGTTLIESALLGRNAFGNDVNPLSVYLTRPRITPPSIAQIANRLAAISWDYTGLQNEDFLVFYHPQTLTAIYALRAYLLERENTNQIDPVDDWIRMVAINRLTGHSSGFFSVYSLPPNQAVSVAAQKKINEKRDQVPPLRHVPTIILKKTQSLLKDPHRPRNIQAKFYTAQSHETSDIPDASVDLVVTSPPFLDVVQYAADNWLRCWFADINSDAVKLSMHRRPEAWATFVQKTFIELGRVVKPGGHVAFEVGEVRNGTVELEQLVLRAIQKAAFEPICVMINTQEFTKTANCWGIENNAKGTNSNRIVLARRQ